MGLVGVDFATGVENITASMIGRMFYGLVGKKDAVLIPDGVTDPPFKCTQIDSTHVTVGEGYAILQGRRFYISGTESVELTQGVSGSNRITLICAQYTCGTVGQTEGVEALSLVAIDGTASATPSDPIPTQGVVESGQTYQMPLIRIYKTGLTITDISYMYTGINSVAKEALTKRDTVDLLWENASPTSTFSAQSITISNLSNYDELLYMVRASTSSNETNAVRSENVGAAELSILYPSNPSVFFLNRRASVSGNTITFTGGNYINMQATSIGFTSADNVAIPVAIYGIKHM